LHDTETNGRPESVSQQVTAISRPDPAARYGASSFPPIAEYAFLSDCETVALVAPSGAVEWMCLPRVDSPSVFGTILDRDAGSFRLAPDGMNVPTARRYLPGTMVLETSWGTGKGWIIVRDVLLIGNWHHQDDRSHTHRRAPTDYDADHVLLRTVRCVNGEVQLLMDCEPKFDYGRLPPGNDLQRRRQRAADAHHRPDARLRGLSGDRPAPDEGGRGRLLRPVVV
jgi:GH15 family glucan-1,4-alpha-glucosidase